MIFVLRLLIISILMMVSSVSFGEINLQSEADSLYRKGNFEKALPLYKQLVSEKPDNPYFHYNLGNSYFKTNRLGKAVASYYRAFYLLPRDADIRYNLSLALKHCGADFISVGVPVVMHRIYYWFSKQELAGFFWIFLWLISILGSVYFLAGSMRKFLRPILLVISFCAVFFGIWRLSYYITEPAYQSVITDKIAELRSGPGENFNASATVPEGQTVEILGVKENWYEIGIHKEGIKGWVKKDTIETIKM